MASKRLQVLEAVKALVSATLPDGKVLGLEADDAKPQSIPPGGLIVVRSGDPGEPDVDLSPLTYNFTHVIPLEVAAYEAGGLTSEEVLDAMMRPIGAAIAADRSLGGLCDWIEVRAPTTEDFETLGAVAGRWADLQIVAQYATPDPLN